VISHGEVKVWCDVYSVLLGGSVSAPNTIVVGPSVEDATNTLATSAANKYRHKFSRPARIGRVQAAGVFLCVVKSEDEGAIPFVAGAPSAPAWLWQRCPQLGLVWIYSLQKDGKGSDVLLPSSVAVWWRP